MQQNTCFPGIIDSDQSCYRYLDKSVIGNEEYLYSNYYREQINVYGTEITYFVNAYNVLSADNFYGEDPTRRFAPGKTIIAIVELSENATTLSKFGFEADDEVTIYVHLSSFYDAFYDIGVNNLSPEYVQDTSIDTDDLVSLELNAWSGNTIDIELDKDKLVECIHSEIDDAIDTDEDSIDDEVTAVLGEMYLESIS